MGTTRGAAPRSTTLDGRRKFRSCPAPVRRDETSTPPRVGLRALRASRCRAVRCCRAWCPDRGTRGHGSRSGSDRPWERPPVLSRTRPGILSPRPIAPPVVRAAPRRAPGVDWQESREPPAHRLGPRLRFSMRSRSEPGRLARGALEASTPRIPEDAPCPCWLSANARDHPIPGAKRTQSRPPARNEPNLDPRRETNPIFALVPTLRLGTRALRDSPRGQRNGPRLLWAISGSFAKVRPACRRPAPRTLEAPAKISPDRP